jgi:hypothetical protein
MVADKHDVISPLKVELTATSLFKALKKLMADVP